MESQTQTAPASANTAVPQNSGTQKRSRGTAKKRIAYNRSRFGRSLVLLMAILIVIALLGNLFTEDREFSDTENRSLAQLPAFSVSVLTDGSWFSEIGDWYNDQFFSRYSWISVHFRLLQTIGQKESGGVYIGKDHFLLMEPSAPDETAIASTVSAMNSFYESYPDLNTTVMIVPDSATVQSDLLPSHAPARDQNQDIAALESQLDSGIHCVDVGAALADHSEEYIYYATDHHWTSLGASYAFDAAIDTLNIRDYATDFDAYTVTDSFQGTLASKSGCRLRSDSIDIYLPKSEIKYYLTRGDDTTRSCSIYNSDALSANDQYTVFFGGNYSKVNIQTTANNGRVLLVMKDSYANSFIQFLLPCYERIIMIDPRYYYGSMNELMSTGVTDVLYLYSADTFLTTTTLSDVLNSWSTDEDTSFLDGEESEDSEDSEDSADAEDSEAMEDSSSDIQSAVDSATADSSVDSAAEASVEEG